MKMNFTAILLLLTFSVSAQAELKLALGHNETYGECRRNPGGNACDLHQRIVQYNNLAADCNEKIDGWFGDKSHDEVPECVQAEALLKKGDIKLDDED